MLLDDKHPKMGLALLMLYEAYEQGAASVELTRGESAFTAAFVIGGGTTPRDVIPNRHWNGLMAALHLLANETALRCAKYLSHAAGEEDGVWDRIEIDRNFPDVNNGRLRELQKRLKAPLVIDLSFVGPQVRIALNRDNGA